MLIFPKSSRLNSSNFDYILGYLSRTSKIFLPTTSALETFATFGIMFISCIIADINPYVIVTISVILYAFPVLGLVILFYINIVAM